MIDQSGLPVPGASIVSKNPKTSTLTRENGDFQIIMPIGDSLIVSSIGYGRVVTKPDSNFITVVMLYSASPLEQVVVGGNLFAVKKKSDISSITVIDSKTLEELPVTDISEIYRGLVPGTNSYSVANESQNNPTLTIRGAASENSISQISVIIDGVEMSNGSGYWQH